MGFSEEVSAALASLGATAGAVVDALADPAAAARALVGNEVVLRASPELRAAVAGYGPEPTSPVWVRVRRGDSSVSVVPLRGGATDSRSAVAVAIEDERLACCESPSCSLEKRQISAWLVLEGEGVPRRLLIAEQRTRDGALAEPVIVVAHRLASALGVPLREDGRDVVGDPPELTAVGDTETRGALGAADLARFALRSEGDRVVLRDWASVGPRATARRNAVIGGALMAVAVVLWIEVARSLGARNTTAAGVFGAAAALLTLTGYAFLGVARFSARYRASSSPVVAFGGDRLIVLPWVSRSGAVDVRPEGRLGAAIPLGEVRRASVVPRGASSAVELDTDHGAIDAFSGVSVAVATFWTEVINRVADEARHPQAGASAKQRARVRKA